MFIYLPFRITDIASLMCHAYIMVEWSSFYFNRQDKFDAILSKIQKVGPEQKSRELCHDEICKLATKLREKSLTIQYCIEKGIDIAELLKTTWTVWKSGKIT